MTTWTALALIVTVIFVAEVLVTLRYNRQIRARMRESLERRAAYNAERERDLAMLEAVDETPGVRRLKGYLRRVITEEREAVAKDMRRWG